MAMKFGKDFVWGAATAAYQIEGAARTDGRGPSVWDMFCRQPGKVHAAHSGDTACDHYHRFTEDVGLMRELALSAYRFSFSWSRILPEGRGALNPAGLGFYDRLLDELLANNITPFATLFHWDYPYQLFLRGGWLNPDCVGWFGDYASILADKFSDRIQNWWTLNEPPCFLGLGHLDGVHAPGLKLDWPEFLIATKHALMAHGRAVQALRSGAKGPCHVGYVPISHIAVPKDESPQSIEAAREFTFGVPSKDRSYWFSRLYLDPVVLGEWPEECLQIFTNEVPQVTQADLDQMCQPLDRLGLNFYAAPTVSRGEDGKVEVHSPAPGHPRTGFDWSVTPDGLYWSIRLHHERYGLPVMIAENGLSSLDWVAEDGGVHDTQRIDFLSRYIKAMHRAYREGYPIEGYFHWSLMDNFEWAEGYRHRFGLVHVDFETQKRTVKDSAKWYRTVIKANGIPVQAQTPDLALVESEGLRAAVQSRP